MNRKNLLLAIFIVFGVLFLPMIIAGVVVILVGWLWPRLSNHIRIVMFAGGGLLILLALVIGALRTIWH